MRSALGAFALVALASAAPGRAASLVVNRIAGPVGIEYTVFFAYEPGGPCVDWYFSGWEDDTIRILSIPRAPNTCPLQGRTLQLGVLPASRQTVIAQLPTGEIYGQISFQVGATSPFLPEVVVAPPSPAPDQPVQVTLSMTNTICAQYRFDQAPQVAGNRITVPGTISYFPFTCPPTSWGEGFTVTLPPLTPGLKEVEFTTAEDGVLARLAFTVAAPPQRLLLRDRFDVRLSWRDAAGTVHDATAVPLTAESGQFWFFRPSNTEMTVKVLDGRGVNGHFWVFAASMTTLPYTLTVTDLGGGQCDFPGDPPPPCPRQVYQGPAGFNLNVIDTEAFADDD